MNDQEKSHIYLIQLFALLFSSESIIGYEENGKNLPYPLIYLILPLVLHRQTRDALPPSIRKHMHVWLQENSHLTIGFAERTCNFVPITKEAIIFGIKSKIFSIDSSGNFIFDKQNVSLIENDKDFKIIRNKAKFVGRWLEKAGDLRTIYSLWGVQP